MKGRPIDQLVFEELYPERTESDPQNFQSFLRHLLLPEVQLEVQTFYGDDIFTDEAKYPGLDYCHPTHRIRLGRYPYHEKLFRAFDNLRLTPNEIYHLAQWEGTKWQRDQYERDHGVLLGDSAFDSHNELVNEQATEETPSPLRAHSVEAGESDQSNLGMVLDGALHLEEADEEAAIEQDGSMQRAARILYTRLMEQSHLQRSGASTTVVEQEWEQWFKNVAESGELYPFVLAVCHRRGSSIFPPSMVETARANRWHEIPEFLHDLLRVALAHEETANDNPSSGAIRDLLRVAVANDEIANDGLSNGVNHANNGVRTSYSVSTTASSAPRFSMIGSPYRRSFSNLRLPSNTQRRAVPPRA